MSTLALSRWLLAGLLLCGGHRLMAQKPIPVILDTDIGDDIDDALALSFALQSPELDIRAITTVLQQGERRADLVYKILELYGRTRIPVGVGAEQTLLGKPDARPVVQTAALRPEEQQPRNERRNGVRLMIDTLLNAPDKLTVLAYGPATNVALALRAEPRIKDKIERLVLMNGVFFKPQAEYNTYRDAEASAIVYSSGLPITTVGLDVTMQCRMTIDHVRQLEQSSLGSAQFLARLIRLWQNGKTEQAPILHDILAIAVTFRPELVRTQLGTVEVETKGEMGKTYGMTLFKPAPQGTTQVASEVQAQPFVQLFMDRLLRGPGPR